MSSTVIQVDRVSKQYRLGSIGSKRLADDLNRWWAKLRGKEDPLSVVGTTDHGTRVTDRIWALNDVSFEVKQGEILGIIGRNGAGKSTLLKIMSRTTAPTAGEVRVKGRIASLLEVGTGFHSELTGRENIFLNGAILGMTKAEIRRKFDEIVDFSGVEQFIDTPVKRYSSGMYVRLAFAVAAHLDPEILIVDEVLAVGDAAFQKKCLGKMGEVARGGRTVLFVSHNMGTIQSLCQRAVWLHSGRVGTDGNTEAVIHEYLSSLQQGGEAHSVVRGRDGRIEIERVALKNRAGEVTDLFHPGESMIVEITYDANCAINRPYFWIGLASQWGPVAGANMLLDGVRPDTVHGRGTVRCIFAQLPLLPQQMYVVSIGGRESDGKTILFSSTEVARFRVTGTAKEIGLLGEMAEMLVGSSSPVLIPYAWELPDGRTIDISHLAESQSNEVLNGQARAVEVGLPYTTTI
jgi:lipopolysaccharide transport system ATP-binding protein